MRNGESKSDCADRYVTTVCVDDFHEVEIEYVHNIDCCGDLGVWSVAASVDDNGNHTYLDRRQAENVLGAIEIVEENLLDIGVVFIKEYSFINDGKGAKRKRNLENREKAKVEEHIKEIEKTKNEREERKKAKLKPIEEVVAKGVELPWM